MQEQESYSVYNNDDYDTIASRRVGNGGGSKPPVRRRKRRRRHGFAKFLLIVAILVGVGLLVIHFLVRPPTVTGDRKDGCYSILLAGTDQDGTRTDTIMLACIDTKNHAASLLSIPRDTLIDEDYTVPKINGTYGYNDCGKDGMEALCYEVSRIIGYEPDGYVLVNFNLLEEMVDLIGGVKFDVPMDMSYSDPSQNLEINLKAGEQVLTGEQAMWLVRFRSGYAMADLQRVSVQQAFVKAMLKQALSVKNIFKIPAFASVYKKDVTTSLSFSNCLYFYNALRLCDTDNMVTNTLPGEGVTYHGGSYYALYGQSVVDLVNEAYNPYTDDVTLADVDIVTVSNGQLVASSGTGTGYDTDDFSTSGSASSSTVSTTAPVVQPSAEPSETAEPTQTPSPSAQPSESESPSQVPSDSPSPSESPSPFVPVGEPDVSEDADETPAPTAEPVSEAPTGEPAATEAPVSTEQSVGEPDIPADAEAEAPAA